MNQSLVRQFESTLGVPLPDDYAKFLAMHNDSFLEPSLLCPVAGEPSFGSPCPLDELLTAADLIANDRAQRSGIPAEGLLHIGGSVTGIYLYMRVTERDFGHVLIADPYRTGFLPVASSFGDFMASCKPESND